jgi:hypothetical protein
MVRVEQDNLKRIVSLRVVKEMIRMEQVLLLGKKEFTYIFTSSSWKSKNSQLKALSFHERAFLLIINE